MTPPAGYFVGIGAQRSGTTWLSRFLTAHPQVGMVPIKECHYWTSKFTRHERHAVLTPRFFRRRFPRLLRYAREPGRPIWPLLSSYAGMMMYRDGSYRRLIDLCGRGARISGEITPSYATLPEAGIRAIETCLDHPRYIMLLRNPADRFLSQISHTARLDAAVLEADPLGDLAHREYFTLRSDYARSLATWRGCVDPARLLLVFSETLFDPEHGQAECDRICDFLGVDRRSGSIGTRENHSTRPAPQVDRQALVAHLLPQYLAVAALFPDSLPRTWRNDMAAVGAWA